jgi:microcystin-dependent protein
MTWDIPLSSNAGAVSSVFGRTGAVVAANGDYFGVVAAALTGATSGTTRLAGALNVSGPPVAGTFQVGDMVMDPSATLWVCTVAGTPGTWSPTVSSVVTSRSATATMALNELTVFTGSTPAQTLTLPSNSVHGTLNQISNYSTVNVTIAGGASSLNNYGVTGNITLTPNQSVQLASTGAGSWYVVSTPLNATVPAGTINSFGGSAAPTGWLLCDGSAVSRTTYAGLFTAISTNYGSGDGSTTFNVPDLRGRIPVGLGTNASVSTLGNNDGVAVANRRPQHNHTNGLTTPNHTHTATQYQNAGASFVNGTMAGANTGSASQAGVTVTDSTGGGIAIAGTIGPSGTNPVDTSAYLVINYIVKT